MPVLEATEYERFSFDEAGQHALTLDEAVRKAKEFRKNDPANFYRIEPADDQHTTFTIREVPVASVYADFMAKVFKIMGRNRFRTRRK
ncbi:MAG: hypothetical protein ACP5E2_08465 [Terracidiphilus sp.]